MSISRIGTIVFLGSLSLAAVVLLANNCTEECKMCTDFVLHSGVDKGMHIETNDGVNKICLARTYALQGDGGSCRQHATRQYRFKLATDYCDECSGDTHSTPWVSYSCPTTPYGDWSNWASASHCTIAGTGGIP
jgi:hypothetical protein